MRPVAKGQSSRLGRRRDRHETSAYKLRREMEALFAEPVQHAAA